MKLLIITGNHPRHYYFVKKFSEFFEFIWIKEKRENFIPEPNDSLNSHIKKLFKLHFEKREIAEDTFFGSEIKLQKNNNILDIIEIPYEELNSKKILNLIKEKNIDSLFTYGCHKISEELLVNFKFLKLNTHGGLSPNYKGSITHFWPTYLMEPQMTGMTLHELTSNIDSGDIIHQTALDLDRKDGVHENSCRAVKNYCDKTPELLFNNINIIKDIKSIKQINNGRTWTTKMWSPVTLKVIYDLFDDKINEYCISNNLINIKPNLKTILKP